MKKILLILILCIIELNAWELICRDYTNASNLTFNEYYYDVNTNTIKFQQLYNGNGVASATNPNTQPYFWKGFYDVHDNNGRYGYRTITNVKNQLKSNVEMLDDFYRIAPQVILNFYYNPDTATLQNHINYTNYELLYNAEGLIVESIVNGVWAGLYDDNEKQFSGKLYGADGGLMYRNGEEVDYIQIFFERLISKFDTTLVGVFWIMGTVVGFGIIAYSVIDTLIFILNICVNVFTGLKYGKVNWW